MGRQLKRELIQCMPIKYSSAIDWNYHPRGTSISQPQHRWVWYLWCWSEFHPGLGYMSHAKTERTEFLVPSGSPHLFFFCVPQERDTFLVIYLPCLGKTRQKERKKNLVSASQVHRLFLGAECRSCLVLLTSARNKQIPRRLDLWSLTAIGS